MYESSPNPALIDRAVLIGYALVGERKSELQVQLPLSPRCCLLLTRSPDLHDRYFDIDDDDGGLAAINRLTCDHAGTALVSRSPTIRSEWFRQ